MRDPERDPPASDELGQAFSLLREESPPPLPSGLASGILRSVRDRLTLRAAVDLLTAGWLRLLATSWLPHGRTGAGEDGRQD